MIYTPLTMRAMAFAYQAHHGQFDRCGVPYIFHPIHLAEQMEDEYTTLAALLHDVVEDTPITLADLEREGFPAQVVEAVGLLTHAQDVPYLEYVKALKTNPIAAAVKRADLLHNSDLSRLGHSTTGTDIKRTEKYRRALELLDGTEEGNR